jgi:hypothetical protein
MASSKKNPKLFNPLDYTKGITADSARKTKQAIELMGNKLIEESKSNYKKFGVYTPYKKKNGK